MTIELINTGGTIDSVYTADKYPDKSTRPLNVDVMEKSLIPAALAKINPAIKYTEWHKRADSKLFTDSDIAEIITYINQTKSENIILTCGTDKMMPIARQIKSAIKNKKVIVTGAMYPLNKGAESDGYKNLSDAAKALSKITDNVCVIFGGKKFDPDNAEKNVEQGRFYNVDGTAPEDL